MSTQTYIYTGLYNYKFDASVYELFIKRIVYSHLILKSLLSACEIIPRGRLRTYNPYSLSLPLGMNDFASS